MVRWIPPLEPGSKVTTSFGLRTQGVNSTSSGKAVALQLDGKIVVAGTSDRDSWGSQMALARYTPNGFLDPTFSDDGKVMTQYGQGWAVAIQLDGRIIVAGDTTYPGTDYTDPASFMLARFNSDGSRLNVRWGWTVNDPVWRQWPCQHPGRGAPTGRQDHRSRVCSQIAAI